jgi:hypothetical protein
MNPQMSDSKWMQRYVFTDLHEIFSGEFPTLKNWTLELVKQLNSVSNPTTRAIDSWLDSVLGGYVTEFVVDCIQLYSVAERDLFKGPHGRFLKSLNTWIKMLLCEKNVMIMKSDS